MTQISFDLHWYDGPATVNGVRFSEVHLKEHADSEGEQIREGWDGTAEVSRSSAPEISPEWAAIDGLVEVRLPEGGTGTAHIMGLTLTDDNELGLTVWEVELTGVGPSPMVTEQL